MTTILINGAFGKMGQMTVKMLNQHSEFTVIQKGHQDNLSASIKESQPTIVIDFTNADAVFNNTEIIIKNGVHPIIGTSGLTKDQIDYLQKECKKQTLGGIIAPNFSLGAVLMMKHAQAIANYFPDIEIIEKHHHLKLDSPSGTAVRTAEMLAHVKKESKQKLTTRETIPGARGANYQNIPIHAVRLPGLLAHQEIIFGGIGETLSIKHDSIDRQCFMPGVLLACQKVTELKELVYGLEHLL